MKVSGLFKLGNNIPGLSIAFLLYVLYHGQHQSMSYGDDVISEFINYEKDLAFNGYNNLIKMRNQNIDQQHRRRHHSRSP